jgi:hypothetical protein
MATGFFTYCQNNSGAYYVKDEENGVAEYVIIEATSPKSAWRRLEDIGDKVIGMFNYCECCGKRWSDYMDEDDSHESPKICGKPLEEFVSEWFDETAFVHYLNGEIKRHFFPRTRK